MILLNLGNNLWVDEQMDQWPAQYCISIIICKPFQIRDSFDLFLYKHKIESGDTSYGPFPQYTFAKMVLTC